MKKRIEITGMTNAVVIYGETHVFHYSNKEIGCDDCSLRRFCNSNNHCLSAFCERLLFWWSSTYKYGVFKKLHSKEKTK